MYCHPTLQTRCHCWPRKEKRGEESDKWKISADRANTSRQVLTKHGVKPEQFKKVAGFADTEPMAGLPPTDENNRRVTVMLKVKGA